MPSRSRRDLDGARPPLPRHTPVGALLPVLAVEEGCFVTTDGRYGRILACTGLNPRIQGAAAAELAAARFGAAVAVLPPDAHLQLVVINRPLRGEDWVPRHLAQYRPPAGPLADYARGLDAAYRRALAGTHIPDLRFYAIVTIPGPPAPKGALARRFRRRRVLARGREAHARTVRELGQLADALAHGLAELEIRAAPLGRQATIDLLWECANPAWGRDVAAPRADTPPAESRALRERLGQSRLLRRREWLRLDGGYEQVLALTALPEATVAGWLADLTAAAVPFRLALHITPLAKAQERGTLTRTLRQRHAVLVGQADQRRVADFDEREAYEEASDLLRGMAAGDLRTFRFAAFIAVRAATAEGLRPAAHAVAKALGDAGGTSIDRCQGWQDRAWQATLPLGQNPAGLTYRVTTTNLADTFPFLQGRAGTPGGHLLGFARPGREVVTLDLYDPALDNHAALLLGKSGSGKTLAAQALTLKHLAWPGRALVFDHSGTADEPGHWDDLALAVGGEVHRLGLGTGYRIDPLALPAGATEPGPDKLDFLLDLLDLMLGEVGRALDQDDRATLEAACRAVYRAHPAGEAGPYLRHLHARLLDPDAAAGDAELAARGRRLAGRLGRWVGRGTYAGLLDGPTTVRADAPLTVFNFRGFTKRPELFAVAMLPLLEHVETRIARRDPLPLALVMDEGWSWFDHPATARFVGDKNRTGRHAGLALLNLSQAIGDYDGPLGRVVRDNASVQLFLRQSPENRRRLGEVFDLTADEEALVGTLATVKEGAERERRAGAYLLARGGADAGLLDLTVTPEEYWLFTSHKPERELRRARIAHHAGGGPPTATAVWAAVRELAALTPEARAALQPRHDDGDETAQPKHGRLALVPVRSATGIE